MPIRLYLNEPSQKAIGEISEEQLAFLTDLLEEENEGDHDYYVDRDLLDWLKEEGADEKLIQLIEPHVPEEDGVEIIWKRE